MTAREFSYVYGPVPSRRLDINPNEAAKIMTHLARTGEIRERRIGDRLYYSAAETGKGNEGR